MLRLCLAMTSPSPLTSHLSPPLYLSHPDGPVFRMAEVQYLGREDRVVRHVGDVDRHSRAGLDRCIFPAGGDGEVSDCPCGSILGPGDRCHQFSEPVLPTSRITSRERL